MFPQFLRYGTWKRREWYGEGLICEAEWVVASRASRGMEMRLLLDITLGQLETVLKRP